MHDVFISYAAEDAPVAERLAHALEQEGFSAWWDRNIPPGGTWDDVIGAALSSAPCVIVLWSRVSVASRWVREEAENAVGRNCLIPALIEAVLPPFGFGRIEAANLVDWDGRSEHVEFQQLRAAVAGLVRREPSPPRLPVKPEPARPPGRVWGPGPRLVPVAIAAGIALVAAIAVAIWATRDRSDEQENRSDVQEVSTTTVTVPTVLGLHIDQARTALVDASLTLGEELPRFTSETRSGTVLAQSPPAGSSRPPGTAVELVVAARSPLRVVELVSPRDQTTFDHYPRTTTLVWKPVPDAESYAVQHTFLRPGQVCAADASPTAGPTIRGLTDTTYTFKFVGAQPGCWRAWAIYPGGEEGPKSAWWQFQYVQ